jgi:hypothetical protein
VILSLGHVQSICRIHGDPHRVVENCIQRLAIDVVDASDTSGACNGGDIAVWCHFSDFVVEPVGNVDIARDVYCQPLRVTSFT